MSNVKCLGSESGLDQCSFTWATEGECNHTTDVVVDCFGGSPTGQPTTPAECEISQLQELLTLARDELARERDARQTQLRSLSTKLSSRYFTLLVLRITETKMNRLNICHVVKETKKAVLYSL